MNTYGRNNKERVGCHKFWESNRNPITMKKCSEENELHIHNRSKEHHIALERWRNDHGRTNSFNFINQ